MDWADDVTYSVHDLEDFYRAGRIPMDLLAGKKEGQRQRFFDDVYQRNATRMDFYPRVDLEEAFGNILAWFWRLDEPYTPVPQSIDRCFDLLLPASFTDSSMLSQLMKGRIRLKSTKSKRKKWNLKEERAKDECGDKT